MTKLKGIVFDLDGTLVDSLGVTFEAFNHGIVSQGGRQHSPVEIMNYFGPGERQIFAAILDEERADEAYLACRRYLDRNLHRVPLHEGIPELLEKIRASGLPTSIVTGRSWNTTEVILRHHGLLGHFVTVVANDHVSRPKPWPDGIRLALGRMGMDPSEAVYVGDMPSDIEAAHAAGTHGAAALWDLMARREAMEPHGPRFVASTPSELWEIVKKA